MKINLETRKPVEKRTRALKLDGHKACGLITDILDGYGFRYLTIGGPNFEKIYIFKASYAAYQRILEQLRRQLKEVNQEKVGTKESYEEWDPWF